MSNRTLCTVALLGLSACVPDLVDNPARDIHQNLPPTYAPTSASSVDVGKINWRDYFGNGALRELVDAAVHNNQEVAQSLQEVFIARAEAGSRWGDVLPRLGASVGAGADKVGAVTSQGYSDESTGLPPILGDFRFGFNASWEVDVWGRLRSAANAADRRVFASMETRHLMLTKVIAEVARGYYELVALDNHIDVLTKNIDIQKNALEAVRAEKAAGRVTELAVQRFEAEVLRNSSRLFEIRQQVLEEQNRLNFLCGRYPQDVARTNTALNDPLPPALEAGVPTQLLDNRPDVRGAALVLEAAKFDVEAARVAFLPALSLDAGVGYRAFDVVHLIATPESLIANLAGNLVAPLLNRSAIEAQYRFANARQIQAVVGYEQALLRGFTDVVNQLSRYQNLQQAFDLQSAQVAKLESAVEVSGVLFQSARADYLEVLLTRRELLDAQMELIETKRDLRLATVNVYEALGGGWRTETLQPH
jgi:outer membrane protein, multidrug efflux system